MDGGSNSVATLLSGLGGGRTSVTNWKRNARFKGLSHRLLEAQMTTHRKRPTMQGPFVDNADMFSKKGKMVTMEANLSFSELAKVAG